MPMQVSAFGDDKSTDTGDVWTLHGYNTKNRFWERDADVEFRFAKNQTHVPPVEVPGTVHSSMETSVGGSGTISSRYVSMRGRT